ncbi:hypothetical protein HETIRDRAFT_429843 [Heterobasidion irregulare TC 32-1]|uniref:ABM domain-containing protein n=1 Tax=Heterobasidion irregulare (strain TC 32-1) TaxID=747525 RepID=W4JS40_HETIT|nr:uncharacterized protein HETIRDRAFT_429843 [Heterobasidion irregulare TC 32-1]ETW76353.1 hypothetical protein HETIRDRAFT_429843 [Heterobasidion irregulare TC 32-1]
MSSKELKFAVSGSIVAKSTQLSQTRELLVGGKTYVDAEPGTLHWFSFEIEAKAGEPARFGVFNGFATEADRDVHQAGGLARAAAANGDALFEGPAVIEKVDLLASKVTPDAKAGIKFGVRVKLTAKPEHAGDVKAALLRLEQDVAREAGTPYWYAVAWPGTSTFGVFSVFYDEGSRQAYMLGSAVKKFIAATEGSVTSAAEIDVLEVLATKIVA